ncbi:hypothetical protein C3B44_03440 [Corynebacterium yudongzhengii]|uniref:DNA-binding protein n=1 Tax=Corynebacterium yudongzhengii TaxID=2080740 RepID=A0A2U1T7F8_9CORY|nr:hypothetical protein C3B44_03440 [Corynebacterium yudongzhengii]PWC01905.1 DNA-binding protein [Corynebacterium yudongzhengii]
MIPLGPELTTQQAADLLNVSQAQVVKLLNEGIVEGHKEGAHRRLRASSVQAFKRERSLKQRAECG